MSRSIHTTIKGLCRDRLSKSELDEMASRDDNEIADLAKKKALKRAVRRDRKDTARRSAKPDDVCDDDDTTVDR